MTGDYPGRPFNVDSFRPCDTAKVALKVEDVHN